MRPELSGSGGTRRRLILATVAGAPPRREGEHRQRHNHGQRPSGYEHSSAILVEFVKVAGRTSQASAD